MIAISEGSSTHEAGSLRARVYSMTDSERYLASLGQRAFLSLWSYPNVYTDEGKPADKGVGKELCDLLVVFGNDIIIFSDKHCAYKITGNVEVDWKRWYRKAIEKSVNQLRGAAAFIGRFPGRIFLEKECVTKFPVEIPSEEQRSIHLVAVTRGSLEACKAHFGGESVGSFMFMNMIKGDEFPFTLGAISSPWGMVHVFDEHSLDVIFNELDTVVDFVGYLKKRAIFLGSQNVEMIVSGEEQLLANYLVTLNQDGEHDFISQKYDNSMLSHNALLHIGEGHWESLIKNPQYLQKKRADKIGYFWDQVISRFIRNGGSDFVEDVPLDWRGNSEPALRCMAEEGRFGRRILGEGLVDFMRRAVPGESSARVMRSFLMPDRIYVLLAEAFDNSFENYEDYRTYRFHRLHAYCLVARLRAPDANVVVGIAFDSPGGHQKGGSEDLLYSYEANLTEELMNNARAAQRELGILLPENLRQGGRHHQEFPPLASRNSSMPISRQQRRALERAEKKRLRRLK